MATVVLVDSGGANIGSVRSAFARLGVEAPITADPERIRAASHVVLPGVGAAPVAMARLGQSGLDRVLPGLHQPVLGICLGMQLLFEATQEGEVRGLGVLAGKVERLDPRRCGRVPHMGWNGLAPTCAHPLLRGFAPEEYAYFVHGYAVPVVASTIATCDYGGAFSAVVAQGNFHGAQFHPERSASAGARLLANFLAL